MAEVSRDGGSGRFWSALDRLVAESAIRIDRPKGSAHPRFPDFVYPLDYGYLEDTQAGDGNEIDVWRGTLSGGSLTGIVCTVDTLKRDCEVKLLIGCSDEEADVLRTHNSGPQSAALIKRPGDG